VRFGKEKPAHVVNYVKIEVQLADTH